MNTRYFLRLAFIGILIAAANYAGLFIMIIVLK